MATIQPIELGSYIVAGDYGIAFVMMSLDEEYGVRYRVVDEDGVAFVRCFADKDEALDFAEDFADNGLYVDDEPGDGMTDAEADADVLASAGMGTDEDYGYFGGDD